MSNSFSVAKQVYTALLSFRVLIDQHISQLPDDYLRAIAGDLEHVLQRVQRERQRRGKI